MQGLRRIITILMWPMVLFLPFWITLGRMFLGSGGWLQIYYFVYIAPFLLVALIVINIIIHFNATFRLENRVTTPQAIVLALLYSCIFLHGIFVVDVGDTGESAVSVAMKILGSGFQNTSEVLGSVFGNTAVYLLLAAFVVALGGRFTWVKSWKAWTVIAVIILIAVGGSKVLQVQHNNDPKIKDEQITYDFQLMKQDIDHLARDNGGVLPTGTAKQVAEMGEFGKEYKIAERADGYTYIPLQEQKQFKLCATFETDTMQTDTFYATADGSRHEGFHRAGYQCITFDKLY